MSVSTEILAVASDPSAINQAAAIIRQGGLVAFPTETVYGLGADALNPEACAKIFVAKGRPANNPLIVHVESMEQARSLVAEWNRCAEELAERFWPGPLTLVLPRAEGLPDVVTAGGPSVGIRWPGHPVAQALIAEAGTPIAAPSANRSGFISPAQPEHVLRGLDGRIDAILDGGSTPGGIESTVLDVRDPDHIRLLRPGLLSIAEIESVVGPVHRLADQPIPEDQPRESPGMLTRHYAPMTPLECFDHPAEAQRRIHELTNTGLRVGYLTQPDAQTETSAHHVVLPRDVKLYTSQLYHTLHQLDAMGLDRIIVVLPPMSDEWLAVRDRLLRASAH